MYIATPIVSMKKKIGTKVFPDFIIAFKFVVESIMCFHHFLQFCIRHQRRFRPSRNPRFESARYSSSSRSLDIVRTRRSYWTSLYVEHYWSNRDSKTVCIWVYMYAVRVRAHRRKKTSETRRKEARKRGRE